MQKILFKSLMLAGVSMSFTLQADSNADNIQTQQLANVVVTATRTETPENQIGSAVSVITAAEIAAKHITSVADALRTVPGLDVVRAGGQGQLTSVFMRGANANHTLVMMDGVEMNDPSHPTGAFDFAFLQTENIERIEILRGAASAVYGSDAIGGVINIISKKGNGPAKFSASAEGGSFGTWKTGGAVSGGTDRVNYSLDASRYETNGFSAADQYLGNINPNAYRNTTVSGRSNVKVNEVLDLGVTLRYNGGKAFFDDCGGRGCDDQNAWNNFQELFTRSFGHLQLFGGKWEQTLGLAYSRTDRNAINQNQYAPVNPYSWTGQNLGEKIKLDYQSIVHLNKANTATMGVEEEADSLHSSASYDGFSSGVIPIKTMNTLGYYLQDQLQLFERSYTTFGVRYDDNNRFPGHVTWRANESFLVKETGSRLKASFGTGFKAPALQQLYDTIYGTGNSTLKPETSVNWDAGVEQDLWREKVTAGATYFNNVFNNLIQGNVAQYYLNQNIGHAKASGVETFFEVRPITDLSLRGSYTHQQTKDLDTGSQLIRRPNDKGSFDVDYRFLEKAHLHVNLLMVGHKADIDPNGVAGYTLLNLSGSYDLHPKLQLFGRIDNLLDKRYEEVYGYGTSGLAGYGGVKTTF